MGANMGIRGKWLFVLAALWPLAAISGQLDTKEAFYLQVNREGLSRVAAEVKRAALSDITNAPLPDIHQEVSLGIKVDGENIRYSIAFGDLSLQPAGNTLAVALGVARVRVDAGRLRFRKRIIAEISTTCENTAVEIVNVPVTARLALSVAGGAVQVAAPELSVPVGDDNYQVHGPSSCSGALGIGSLVKLVVKEVLKSSKSTIESKLAEAARGLLPELGRVFTASAQRRLPIDLDKWLGIGRDAFSLVTTPHLVSVSDAGLELVLSASAESGNHPSRDGEEIAYWDGSPLGQAGVNPDLLTEALAKWLPQGTPQILLTEEIAPGVSQALTVEFLKAVWPDLQSAALSSGNLRAKIRAPRAPVVKLGPADGLLTVDLPTEWTLQAQIGGQWKDYFLLRLDFRLDAEATIASGKLSVGLGKGTTVAVSGEWAAGYTPTDPRFEQQLAEAVFAALVEVVAAGGPLVGTDVPQLELASGRIIIANPRVHAPYVRVDLVSAD